MIAAIALAHHATLATRNTGRFENLLISIVNHCARSLRLSSFRIPNRAEPRAELAS